MATEDDKIDLTASDGPQGLGELDLGEPSSGAPAASEPAAGRRRRRDPFKGMEQVLSSEAALKSRELTSLSELKRIKRARLRHEGQQVVTDDIKKLKSLTIEPRLPPGEYINYYVEPVRIEYYIPRESRFATERRFLYIPLIDPEPRTDPDDKILRSHIEQNRFIDLIDLMNQFPVHITDILESYGSTMNLYESLSRSFNAALSGNEEAYKSAFYLCEALTEYEPTIASLQFLGEFLAWDLNWLTRAMNTLGIEFAASDKTIAYFIKKRNDYWEQHGLDYDERFEILAALFYEQAFPNRHLEYEEEDYFYDIFDKKHSI